MSVRELAEFVRLCTTEYRKGPEVEAKGGAVHIYAMPPSPERGVLVDLHFIKVGFTEAAADKARFVSLLAAALNGPGEFCGIPPQRLADGPSYIELGAWIGDQGTALMLMALGKLHELWDVITPATLRIEGEEADKLAGMGMVMVGPRPGLVEQLQQAVSA